MTQKLPFNNISGPTFAVGHAEAVLFHKLEGDSDVLWALSLWVATNNTIISDFPESSVQLAAVPAGAPVTDPAAAVVTAKIFSYDATALFPAGDVDVGDQQKIIQICTDVPLRGPLDLYLLGAHEAGELNKFSAWGYVNRGDAVSKTEKRFLSEAAIGDQINNFAGGQAILFVPDDLGKAIHKSSEEYIDEVTVDLQSLSQGGLTDPETAFAFAWDGGAIDAGAVVRLGAKPARIFDGIPVRAGGTLIASYPNINTEPTIVVNGHFARG